MRFGQTRVLKLLTYLLAWLAALQPACSVVCLCPCREKGAVATQIEQPCRDCDDHCHHSHEQCSGGLGSNSTPTEESPLLFAGWCFGLHACNCPSDCDCHLRHSSQSGVVSATKLRVPKQQVSSWIVVCPDWPRSNQLVGAAPNYLAYRSHVILDAPSSCAVLCRFTI